MVKTTDKYKIILLVFEKSDQDAHRERIVLFTVYQLALLMRLDYRHFPVSILTCIRTFSKATPTFN